MKYILWFYIIYPDIYKHKIENKGIYLKIIFCLQFMYNNLYVIQLYKNGLII